MSDPTSSLPSPKIRFKELDVEFLQKQARIWLETVIGERYDLNVELSALLADGEILRKVSSKIWEFIHKQGDKDLIGTASPFSEATSNGKLSRRYLPYSNIDTFLKVCQKLGLTGVDLFSPPDVVEEKDIRRVCLCVRALSQKARARNVKVPNFDNVTHTATLPAEIVGGVKSLTHHLNAAIIENKENPEKLLWGPLLPKRSTDKKGVNGLSTNPPITDIPKDKDCVVSTLITDVTCPKVNGKSFKATRYANGLAPPEEISKSTNDSKVLFAQDDEPTVFYEGFRKKVNRALFEYDNNLKQGSQLSQKLLDTPEAEGVISCGMSCNGDTLKEPLCAIVSYTDTLECISANMDEKQISADELLDQKSPTKGNTEKPRRRTWAIVTFITMAVLGAALIFRTREPNFYKRNRNYDHVLLQIPKKESITSVKTEDVQSDESS